MRKLLSTLLAVIIAFSTTFNVALSNNINIVGENTIVNIGDISLTIPYKFKYVDFEKYLFYSDNLTVFFLIIPDANSSDIETLKSLSKKNFEFDTTYNTKLFGSLPSFTAEKYYLDTSNTPQYRTLYAFKYGDNFYLINVEFKAKSLNDPQIEETSLSFITELANSINYNNETPSLNTNAIEISEPFPLYKDEFMAIFDNYISNVLDVRRELNKYYLSETQSTDNLNIDPNTISTLFSSLPPFALESIDYMQKRGEGLYDYLYGKDTKSAQELKEISIGVYNKYRNDVKSINEELIHSFETSMSDKLLSIEEIKFINSIIAKYTEIILSAMQ